MDAYICGMCDPKRGGSLEGFKRFNRPRKVLDMGEGLGLRIDLNDIGMPEYAIQCPMCQEYWKIEYEVEWVEAGEMAVGMDGFSMPKVMPKIKTNFVPAGKFFDRVWKD